MRKGRVMALLLAVLLAGETFFLSPLELHAETLAEGLTQEVVEESAAEEEEENQTQPEDESEMETETETETETDNRADTDSAEMTPGESGSDEYEIYFGLIEEEISDSAQEQRNRSWSSFSAEAAALEAGVDYAEGVFGFEASSKSEAEQIVSIYGGYLLGYSYGIGEMIIPEKTTEEVMEACIAAVEDGVGENLPVIYPNNIIRVDEEESGKTAATMESEATATAESSAEPEATTEAEPSKEPETTTAPSKEPETTTETTSSKEPEATAEATPSEEPEATAEATPSEEPEATAEAASTETPAATAAASPTGSPTAAPVVSPEKKHYSFMDGTTIAEEPENEITEEARELSQEEIDFYQSLSGAYDENADIGDILLTRDENGTVSVVGDNFYSDSALSAKTNYYDTPEAWWHHIVNEDYAAWNTSLGTGVTVAVIDSGATKSHPDLAYAGVYNAFSRNYNSLLDAYADDNLGSYNQGNDNHGHGTHVAGIIAAKSGNGGVCGVAPGAKIISIKALETYGSYSNNSATGTDAVAARAVNMAVAKGAKVINMSLGGEVKSELLAGAITKAVDAGCVVVCAAGNDGKAVADVTYPAALSNTISVAATKQSGADQVIDSSYSNTGSTVDIAAPGTQIRSTYLYGLCWYMSGTSMATPMVSGAIALYLSNNKELLAVKDASVHNTVKNALINSAVDKGEVGKDNSYGYGVLNTRNLVGEVATAAKPRFSVNGGNVQEGYGVQLFSSNGADSIYYTMDGTKPTKNSLNYGREKDGSGLIYFPKNATSITLQAVSIVNGSSSPVATAKFTIVPDEIDILDASYKNNGVLAKQGYFCAYNKISGVTLGEVMPYQTYKISLNPGDQLSASLMAKGFNGELYVLQGSQIKDSDVRDIINDAYSYVNEKNARTCDYTNNSGTTQEIEIVVTSGALLYNQSLGQEAGKGTYTLATSVTKAPQSISVSAPDDHVISGKKIKMAAAIRPFDTTNQKVDWKLCDQSGKVISENIAKIDSTGQITVGKITEPVKLYVKASSQAKSSIAASTEIMAYPATAKIEMKEAKIALVTNSGSSFDASSNFNVMPAGVMGKYSYTSSKPGVASVTEEGQVTAISNGSTVITVKALDGSGKSGKFTVNVTTGVTDVKMNVSTKMELIEGCYPVAAGTSVTLGAAIEPENASNQKVDYFAEGELPLGITLSGNKLKIDASVQKDTTFTITVMAKDGTNVSTKEKFKVFEKPSQVLLSESSCSLDTVKDKTITIRAEVKDKEGNIEGIRQTVSWSSNNLNVAAVDQNGKVTAVGKGTATITAVTTDGSSLKKTVSVKVAEGVEKIEIMPQKALFGAALEVYPIVSGKTTGLQANVVPSTANNKKVTWSLVSAPEGVKISASGALSVPKDVTSGNILVRATAADGLLNGSGATAEKQFKIYSPVQKISITTPATTLNTVKKATVQMTANLTFNGEAYKGVAWQSSNAKVATVSTSGLVTAVGKGTTTITATTEDGSGVKATQKITVVQPMTSFTIENKTGATDASGKMILISGNNTLVMEDILPATPSNKNVEWSLSGDETGTVSINAKNGAVKVNADKAEPNTKVKITATIVDSGEQISRDAVIYPATKNIYLSKSQTLRRLHVGETLALKPTCNPVKCYNQINGGFEYTSSNSGVVTVDENGVVTAVGKGIATVTVKATDGSKKTAKSMIYIYD